MSALHNQGDAIMDQRSAQELKDQVDDVGGKDWDPARSQNRQVQSEPTSSPLIDPTLQNPSENSPDHEAVHYSGSPQLLAAAPLPLGHLPALPGGILVHHLYQDPLYPGFPQGENGSVLPTPEFSLHSSGEDLPQGEECQVVCCSTVHRVIQSTPLTDGFCFHRYQRPKVFLQPGCEGKAPRPCM